MKSIFVSLLFVLIATSYFSQENVVVGRAQTPTELTQSKNTGEYTFFFPETITKEQIETAANYYPNFFSYSVNEEENSIKISLVENNTNNRRVIMRFLMSARLQKISVGENQLLIHDFFESYLN